MSFKNLHTHLPAFIRDEIEDSSKSDKKLQSRIREFNFQFEKKAKKPDTAQALSLIGFHYFYLEKIFMAILYMITFGGFGIWWLIDLFRSKAMPEAYNNDLATDLYRKIVG